MHFLFLEKKSKEDLETLLVRLRRSNFPLHVKAELSKKIKKEISARENYAPYATIAHATMLALVPRH